MMLTLAVFISLLAISAITLPARAHAHELLSDKLLIQTGEHGEISSIKIKGDQFPTEYVMNKIVTPEQDTADHQWLGELIFTYRLNGGEWTKAWTNKSDDARTIVKNSNKVTVTYENSQNPEGIRNFKLIETYSLEADGHLQWDIRVVNTGTGSLEIGDLGLPMPFNEQWKYGDSIYETRVVTHSFVGNNSSYITAGRPSGIGSYLLMIPDADTDAGFEYQDRWRDEEHPGSKWAWDEDHEGQWVEGLNVFYIHSKVIKSTNRGYLPNTSLILGPGESKDYGFKLFGVDNEQEVKNTLYNQGLMDTTVIPGMIIPSNQKAKFDLRTKAEIHSVKLDDGTEIPLLEEKAGDHHIYEFSLTKLGPQHVTVEYGSGLKTVLQFYGIDSIDKALEVHSTFMVENTQWNLPGDLRDKVFDDWMMNTKTKRNNFSGYWGWGDDWGLTHGQFLAEKNALTPVESEVSALDDYLETAIWNNLMNGHHDDYLIHDFLMPEPNTTPTYRGYAYPHVYNTYFSMYKIAANYPDLVVYKHPKETYLLRAYNIFKALYEGPVAYNWETGLMGELTTPDIIQALEAEGYVDEANDIRAKMIQKYNNFKNTTYPYGSEYSYDNTGEEAVYTLAKMQSVNESEQAKALEMMAKINGKTRASRGQMPIWYYYADPVTITGENWWNFQYTTSLAGYAMDDWIRYHAQGNREEEQRLSYAAKIANFGAINSGQISDDPENYGAAAWTYQAEKGNWGTIGTGGGKDVPLMNGWKGMTGEADLGLFGALQTLSADIAVDPIFGVTGYGAEVSVVDDVYYDITPKDGLYKRINLITEKLYIELDKDQFTRAKLSSGKDYAKFSLRNLTPGTTHETTLDFDGLKKGTYLVKLDDEVVGKFNAYGQEAKLTIEVGTAVAYTVELSETTPDNNEAPVINAGEDFQYTLEVDDAILRGQAKDDGLPLGILTSEWSLESGPLNAEVSFGHSQSLFTSVTVSEPGTYVFKLTVSDSDLSASDTVTVEVTAAPPLPELLAHYMFDETDGQTAADSSGSGNEGRVIGSASWAAGKSNNAIRLSGQDGYVKLPEGLLSRVDEITVSAWVKANSIGTYARIFDFGTGSNSYMFLSPKAGSITRFAITTGGNAAGQEQTIDAPALSTGDWKHIAVTLSGSTGILYIDGIEAGRNNNMTLNPSDLGKTKNNFIGKSQFSDPYFDGLVDDFRIYSKALSPAEVAAMVAPQGEIVSVEETNLTTPAQQAPKLPAAVQVTMKDGSKTEVAVHWEAVDPALYDKEGSEFTVNGTIVGTETDVIAHIIVTAREIEPFPSLVVRYNFDEAEGNDVIDASGSSHNGTIQGTLTRSIEGHKNGSLTFDGQSGNYINAGSDTALQPGSMTLSYWIKRTEPMNTRENVLLWFKPEGNYAGNGFFVTYNGNSSIVFVDGGNGFYVEQSPDEFLPLNEWTHVVFTFDKETKTGMIYKNGIAQQVDMEGSPESITTTDNVKKIGVSGYGDGAQLHAGLDDFRIYNGAMSASQVRALYEDKDIQSVMQVQVTTPAATAPVLPETVPVHYENGTEGTAAVSWEDVQPESYLQPGEFNVNGRVEGTALLAKAVVTVTKTQDKIVKELREANVSTVVKQKPVLPTVVQATYEDGTLGTVNVIWEDIDPARYGAAGIFTVTGDASGTDLPAVAKVTVLDTAVPVIVSLREVEVTTKAGKEPVLPTVITATYDDDSMLEVKVVWAHIAPNQYAVPGSFTVRGVVEGTQLAAKATVLVTAGNSPTPTTTPTQVPGATTRPTPMTGTKIMGEDAFAKGQSSLVEVLLEGGQTSVSLPVNAGALLDKRSVTIGNGKVSLTIPASVLTELGAKLSTTDSKGASIIVRLAEGSPITQPVTGSGIYKLEGTAYEFGLVLRKADGTEVVLSTFPQAIKVVLPYSATAQDENLLGVYLYNEKTSQWNYAGGIIDTVRKEAVIELDHFSTYAVLSYNKSFEDVSSGHWVYGALKSLTAKHVANGMTENHFVPNGRTTRAEFTSMLVRALHLQENVQETPFGDVKEGSWYAASVRAAYQAGLIEGVSETAFMPDAIITREQMAVLLIKAYEYKLGGPAPAGSLQSIKNDVLKVSDWADTAVGKALDSGLMQGIGNGQFDPQGSASRAQTVQAIYNLLQVLEANQ
ncbi:MAG: Ig-like domain-containing protein [Paenibacillus sp.]|nr:Ig-like domain-containing protein [Paenibacillus sp.]